MLVTIGVILSVLIVAVFACGWDEYVHNRDVQREVEERLQRRGKA